MALDALGTNLLAAATEQVGGRDGGFELRLDRFRDAIMQEARKAGYSRLLRAEGVLVRPAALRSERGVASRGSSDSHR
jgi:hypothetical protein